MAAYDVLSFDGTSIASGTNFDAWLDARDQYVMTGTVDSIQRRSAAPLVTGTSEDGRTIILRIANAPGSALTAAQFRDAVKALFDHRDNASGERILVIKGDDGTTNVQTGCYVTPQLEYLSAGVDQYVITLWSPSGIWQATSLTTSASNPATVTNAGNTIARPTIALSDPATTVTRHACTVTGGGVIAYPVRIELQADGIAVTSSSTANPTVITTAVAHGLTTGDTVIINGHSDATINGTFTATVTSSTTFTIPVNGATSGPGTGGTLYRNVDPALYGLATENFAVYVEGVSVPFYVVNTALTYIWLLVDTASDGTTATNVDVLYGASISNPLAGTLDDGGMDWADYFNCTNSQWSWDDWSTVSSNPARPGVWRPALTGNHSDAADATYKNTGTSAVLISLDGAGIYDNSSDSVRLHVGAKAGTSSALANLSRVTANLDGSNARAYVRYRVAGSATWTNAWTQTSNATVSTAIDLDNAVEIVVGLENFGSTADPSSLTVNGVSSTSTARLTLTDTPTLFTGSATTMDVIDGDLTINGRTITFSHLIVPDGTLTVDAKARSITSSVAGPFYGDEDALTFSHPDQWFALSPGSNAVSNSTDADLTVVHQESWL